MGQNLVMRYLVIVASVAVLSSAGLTVYASSAQGTAELSSRSEPVFTGPDYVLVGPPKSKCRLSLSTALPLGTKTRLEFVARSFIMPWDTVDPPDSWAWRSLAKVPVTGGRVSKIVKVTQDGYWRYWSSQGPSEPRFIDVYPTSDLADPGVPGAARMCRGA